MAPEVNATAHIEDPGVAPRRERIAAELVKLRGATIAARTGAPPDEHTRLSVRQFSELPGGDQFIEDHLTGDRVDAEQPRGLMNMETKPRQRGIGAPNGRDELSLRRVVR